MRVERLVNQYIEAELAKKHSKIMVVYGARQVGKTTLVEDILKNCGKKILRINGDRLSDTIPFSSRDLKILESVIAGYDILFIDEAQRIPEIGINLKILYDNFKELKIIVTGSSSLDLASSVKEPLTGRKYQFTLYPISFLELSKYHNTHELEQDLNERLIFGSYPNILSIKNRVEKTEYIAELTEDYLYKDVLELENIKYHQKLRDLLRLLAFQIGSEVSINELAMRLGLNQDTVARYIDLLEKSFVIFTLHGFSRNLRKEVSKKPKIYFYDLGIRNAIIGNFNEIAARNDIGALWENFLIIERLKKNEYSKHLCLKYFWRTYTGAELDYIEEYGSKLYGYEFKWSKSAKAPQSWVKTYDAEYFCINKDNFTDFIVSSKAT
jgi:predicted AAA+ superfamily ATPase